MNRLFLIFILLAIPLVTFCQPKSFFSINDELFEIPGKWKLNNHLPESGQYSIVSKKEGLILLISVRDPKKFEFYQESFSDTALLDAYYTWERDYWIAPPNKMQAEVSVISKNPNKVYMIWKMTLHNMPQIENKTHISYLLYAVRNKKLISISLSSGYNRDPALEDAEAVTRLEKIYLR